jgi:hypothetical protein
MLALRGRGHFGDADVADVTALALAGLKSGAEARWLMRDQ